MQMIPTRREPQEREERPWPAAQLIRNNFDGSKHSTRGQRRAYLVSAMEGGPVLSFAAGVDRLRARLDGLLLDENPDQQAQSRAWGERAVS